MMGKGFRFGLLLQLAIGPVCIFIFSSAATRGFLQAEKGVLGVAFADALYIGAALLGLGRLFKEKEKIQKRIKLVGGMIVLLFGIQTIVSVFGVTIIPTVLVFSKVEQSSIFLQTLLLTLSNPLTILFWAGVFATKISEENMGKGDLRKFAVGAVGATLSFLSLISFIGSMAKQFLPSGILRFSNLLVGLVLCYFGLRTLNPYRKDPISTLEE